MAIKVTVVPLQEVATKTLAALSAKRRLPDLLAVEVNYFSRYMRNDLAGARGARAAPEPALVARPGGT